MNSPFQSLYGRLAALYLLLLVVASAVRVRTEPAPGGVRVAVSDVGYGIAPDDLLHVTRRFCRTPHSRTRGASGSGSGLAIARELVELHGGTLRIESHVGRGTTVSFMLPTGGESPGATRHPL